MTKMTRSNAVSATIMGLLISISLLSISTYGQENEFNLTEFRSLLSNLTYSKEWPNVHPNVLSDFADRVVMPKINETAFVHPFAIVIGDCHLGQMVYMAPTAVCREDVGMPIVIKDYSNIGNGVILHAVETHFGEHKIDGMAFSIDGKKLMANDTEFDNGYPLFVGSRVSLAHGAMVHGPAWIGNNTFVGMESTIFNAKIGNNVSIGVASTITGDVEVPDNRYLPPGSVITTQEQADALPPRVGSPYEKSNDLQIHVNKALAEGYPLECIQKDTRSRESCMENGMLETSMPQ
jgi:carbonic anhydrase/acetyltransferase-like protein (isoleucine patch superfamily)